MKYINVYADMVIKSSIDDVIEYANLIDKLSLAIR